MRLDLTLVHLTPLVNSYKGRDYFSTFVFYSANLKDLTNLTEFSYIAIARMYLRDVHSAKPTAASVSDAAKVCVFCAVCVR